MYLNFIFIYFIEILFPSLKPRRYMLLPATMTVYEVVFYVEIYHHALIC